VEKLETIVVKQQVVVIQEFTRTVSLRVPAGCRDIKLIDSLIDEGEAEFGPFPFHIDRSVDPVLLGSRVLRRTKKPADIPFVERTES
jgi:hypothetical protein